MLRQCFCLVFGFVIYPIVMPFVFLALPDKWSHGYLDLYAKYLELIAKLVGA